MQAWIHAQPFPKRQISDSFKFKAFADDNLKSDENGRKSLKQVENEKLRVTSYFTSSKCFQKTYTEET